MILDLHAFVMAEVARYQRGGSHAKTHIWTAEDELKHPRAHEGKHGGQFTRKGTGGGSLAYSLGKLSPEAKGLAAAAPKKTAEKKEAWEQNTFEARQKALSLKLQIQGKSLDELVGDIRGHLKANEPKVEPTRSETKAAKVSDQHDEYKPADEKPEPPPAPAWFKPKEPSTSTKSVVPPQADLSDRIKDVFPDAMADKKPWRAPELSDEQRRANTQAAVEKGRKNPDPVVTLLGHGRSGVLPERPKDHIALAHTLAATLKAGAEITSKGLFSEADFAHGGTRAEGKYGHSEALDSLEAAVNISLDGYTDPTASLDDAARQVGVLDAMQSKLPTQTNRSGNKESFQQFSTPPHYSFAVNWAANIQPGEVVLEPSAGTGSLAIHAKNAGANVYANELDDRRADFLRDQFGADHVFTENAEQIGAILPKRMPMADVVVMNPPFSQTAGRMGDKKDLLEAAKHIDEALLMLKPGGRLVAIVGGGMTPDKPTYRDWFKKIAANHDLRANVLVDGDVYKKYGTHFDSRVLVIDKLADVGESVDPLFTGELTDSLGRKYHFQDGKRVPGPIVEGAVTDIQGLMTKLEGVRNDRQQPNPESSGERDGDQVSHGSGGDSESADATNPATGNLAGGATPADVASSRADSTSLRPDDIGDVGASGAAGVRGLGGSVGGGLAGPVEQPGQPQSKPRGSGKSGSGGKSSGKQHRGKPGDGEQFVTKLKPAVPLEYKAIDAAPVKSKEKDDPGPDASDSELGDSLYESYRPQRIKIAGAHDHPTPLVETAAMAAVTPPPVTYQPVLSPSIVSDGLLSAPQLEGVIYAGQAHQQMLDGSKDKPPRRRGFFIGDGTGAAKGRQLAAIMSDNFNQGRRKAVWVTKSANLVADARRDWSDIGNDPSTLFSFDAVRHGVPPGEGVCVITYDTLKSKPKKKPGATTEPKTNLDTLLEWLGPDFEGVIAFDESHLMGNAQVSEGEYGKQDASQRALKGVEFQDRLPKARVVYSSATGATEIENLGYADRLGIWGPGTEFPTKGSFFEKLGYAGVAGLEAIAQSLKATGNYISRALSFNDGTPQGTVSYDRVDHKLTSDQYHQYDALADAWQVVLQNINAAMKVTGAEHDHNSRKGVASQFWGTQQRFFNQVMTSMQTPTVIAEMEADLKAGRSPIVQITQTGEAQRKRAKEKLGPEETLEDLDISPREVIIQYLDNCFPVGRFETYTDGDGNVQARPVMTQKIGPDGKPELDTAGKPLMIQAEDPRAIIERDKLKKMVGRLSIPDSPLDMIVKHFGHQVVAECTGRSKRSVWDIDEETGLLTPKEESRNITKSNDAETESFQNGDKRILIFSEAGGTGRSYHASRKAKNQGQRVHYLLQPGWRADTAVQGFGRSHRTNQSSAPKYRLVEITDLPAQRRFVSTIARRLDQLGALTKGQRQAGGGGLFKQTDNLESSEAETALGSFIRSLKHNGEEGLEYYDVMHKMGLIKEDEKAKRSKEEKEVTVKQFLNRMLALRPSMQQQVFSAYDKHLTAEVERAMDAGTLDVGVEDFKADSLSQKSDKIIHTDAGSGATVRHVVVSAKNKTKRLSWEQLHREGSQEPLKYVKNKASGQVWAVYHTLDHTDAKSGAVTPQYKLFGPAGGRQQRAKYEVDNQAYYGNFMELTAPDAAAAWDSEFNDAPEFTETDEHFLSGALLPVWNRIPGGSKVYRLKLANGEKFVGRKVEKQSLPMLLKNFNLESEHGEQHTAPGLHAKLLQGRHEATLLNGWRLRPARVQNEKRIEVIGPTGWSGGQAMEQIGAIEESIAHKNRYFIPTSKEGVDVLNQLLKTNPATDVKDLSERAQYSRPNVPGAQMALFDAPAPGGQKSLFNVVQSAPKVSKAVHPQHHDILAAVDTHLRAHLAKKPTLSEADKGTVVQKPALGGQKAMFSRERMVLDLTNLCDRVARYEKDSSGHEHKGRGPGGGQFTGTPGGGGGASQPAAKSAPKAEKNYGTGPLPQTMNKAPSPHAEMMASKLVAHRAGVHPGDPPKPKAQPAAGATAGVPPSLKPIVNQPTTPPPPGKVYNPNPGKGHDARVGVPAMNVPPPPALIPRLPNLNPKERAVEHQFATQFEQNPDGMADQMIAAMANGMGDGPNVFATDEAKNLFPAWQGRLMKVLDPKTGKQEINKKGKPVFDVTPATKIFRSQFNTCLHQTANGLAKRAFVKYLDTVVAKLPPEKQHILVTAGGVAAGKGFAIENVPAVNELSKAVGATWDSAGEQNSTELPWLAEECQKRGFKMTAVFVHSKPTETWENPERGVMERAAKKGRMVDARVFADSYTHGARNFQDFATNAKASMPHVTTMVLDNTRPPVPDIDAAGVQKIKENGKPATKPDVQPLPQVPQEMLSMKPDQLYLRCLKTLATAPVPAVVKTGGARGVELWGAPKASAHAV